MASVGLTATLAQTTCRGPRGSGGALALVRGTLIDGAGGPRSGRVCPDSRRPDETHRHDRRGKLFRVLIFRLTNAKIARLEVIGDPARLRELDIGVLELNVGARRNTRRSM
jgi:hypothetical protein